MTDRGLGRVGRRAAGRRIVGRLATAGRAVLATVVLVGLLVGVPAALLALGANPLAVQLPSLNRVGQLLTSPDDGTVWLAAARVIGWVGWAGFALSVLVEAAAAVAGATVPVLPGLGGLQRPVGYLIALITTALVAPTAAPAAGAAAAVAQTATAAPAPPAGHQAATPAVDGGSAGQPSPPGPAGTATPPAPVAAWGGGGAGPTTHALPGDRAGGRLPVVRVARYDTLWRLAERHLHDGRRWTEIYRLNHDQPQPDGARLTDPDQIRAGWILTLPADATGTTTPTAVDSAGRAGAVIVQPGDTLSGIAQRHLGTAAATAALFEANAGRPQPDGGRLTDPDLIRPGWILTLPGPPTQPAPHPPAPPTTPPARPPRAPLPVPTTPAPTQPPTPPSSPPSSLPTSPPSSPGGRVPVPPAASPPAATPQPPAAPSVSPPSSVAPGDRVVHQPGGWVRLPSGSVLALGLAATLAGLVVLVRRRWRRHRLPGDPSATDAPPPPPLPPAAAAAEAGWLASQRRGHEQVDEDTDTDVGEADDDDPLAGTLDDVDDRPDIATPLAAGAAGERFPDPLADAADAAGAAADAEGAGVAVAAPGAGGLLVPGLGELVGPPAAAALAERVWAGGVGLTGPGAADAARAVLARLLTGAGPLGSGLLTTTAAVADLLPAQLLPAGAGAAFAGLPGVRVFGTLAAALTAGEAELLGRARRLAEGDTPDLAAYRQLPDADPVPAVLLLAHTPATAAESARAQALLQLAAGRDLGAVWLGPWPPAGLHVTADGGLHRPPEPDQSGHVGQVVGRVELLTPPDAVDLLAGLLPTIRDSLDVLDPTALLPTITAPPPAPPAPSAGPPDAGRTEVEADAAEAATAGPVLEVAVLGRVRVTAARQGREVTGLRAKVRDLLTLLAVHPDGLTSDQVGEALWPDAPPQRVGGRLSATLALARRTLRQATGLDTGDGDTAAEGGGPVDLLPLLDGRYRLHPDLVDTDHRQFTTALADARRAAEDGDTAAQLAALTQAADLYHGEPLDGVAYPWAEPVRERLRRQATDTLATLADLHADSGGALDAAGRQAGLDALERAVEVDPYNEELYRRLMRLHAAAGRTDAVRRTYRLLEARLADLDVDPDPDTTALVADLTRPARSRPARAGAGRR